jgi:hypothetical protein
MREPERRRGVGTGGKTRRDKACTMLWIGSSKPALLAAGGVACNTMQQTVTVWR